MNRYLQQEANVQETVELSNRRGLRAQRRATEFLETFQSYVNAYSGVIQVMNGVGPGYGDAAYGALSLFLVVCY
jgi:pyruvate-formate lyase